jgi:hypothetical protein
MVTVNIDISQIKSDITQIHNELHATYNMTDTGRRDTVNRIIEKLRTLKTALEENKILAVIK